MTIRVVCKLQARVVPIRPALATAPIFSPLYYTTTSKCGYNSRVLLLDMSNNVRNILQPDLTLVQRVNGLTRTRCVGSQT